MNYTMVSTLFKIEKGIGIRNESRPQAKFFSGGDDRVRPKGSAAWFLEVEPEAMIVLSDQPVSIRIS
jgi:hypothetical protein